ncbi:hypothetical protein CDL15_Pgr016747 [Punica granatum]|uniref:DUF4219 domain-containing protein n=1 Tax=Punica granatum TaxID=22663 RepID=A0A218WY97_PUNGR|nr:hypothetical protein CDL15_Pgr016747 [Punica granatum]
MNLSSNDMAFNYSQRGIPIFVREKYEIWSILIKTLFSAQDLWDIVDNSYETVSASLEELGLGLHNS